MIPLDILTFILIGAYWLWVYQCNNEGLRIKNPFEGWAWILGLPVLFFVLVHFIVAPALYYIGAPVFRGVADFLTTISTIQ